MFLYIYKDDHKISQEEFKRKKRKDKPFFKWLKEVEKNLRNEGLNVITDESWLIAFRKGFTSNEFSEEIINDIRGVDYIYEEDE